MARFSSKILGAVYRSIGRTLLRHSSPAAQVRAYCNAIDEMIFKGVPPDLAEETANARLRKILGSPS